MGSQIYLAGPALVRAAIGQTADPEELGAIRMHAEISETVDFRKPDDHACLRRLRSLIELLQPASHGTTSQAPAPSRDPQEINSIVPGNERTEFDIRDVLSCVIDASSMQEFRADFGTTLVTA